jgi:hypothetical protein
MKLKSETKQVIDFLKHRHDCAFPDKTVTEVCKMLNLNFDMVQRALIRLHKQNVIGRDSRGKGSSYEYPARIGLGDIVNAVEGINLDHSNFIRDALNKVGI